MNILVNASNIKKGGAIQVTDSIIHELYKYPQHHFVVVYSDALCDSAHSIVYDNVELIHYQLPIKALVLITGRNKTLDSIVELKKIQGVITVFGPSRWRPSVLHVSGFAIPHLLIPESPFFKMLSLRQRFKLWLTLLENKYSVNRSSNHYYTENPFITTRLKDLFPSKEVITITNNANQVFYEQKRWDYSKSLPSFNGSTFLTIAANYPHKNLSIILPTIDYLLATYRNYSFRFVLTIDEKDLGSISEEEKEHIVFLGSVKIEQCPYLYQQSDVMVLPTLLECFSASYAEAMVMRKPIVTSDLEFAKGLCGDAAVYIDPVSPKSLGDALFEVCSNHEFQEKLINEGQKQILKFDPFDKRAEKIIQYITRIAN